MAKFFTLFLLTALFFSQLKGAENPAKQVKAPVINVSIQNIESITDADLIKGFSSIKFLVNIPTLSLKASNNMQALVVAELKKTGKVIIQPFSVQRLAEEKELLKSPSLTYSIKKLQDLDGQSLSLFQISLICEAAVEIANNKQYGQALVWGRECFLKESPNISLESVMSKTLPLLLQQFKSAYLEANSKDTSNLTFLVLE